NLHSFVRASGKSTVLDRLEEIFISPVFDTLRSNYSSEQQFRENIIKIIVPIQGDVSQDNFGMSPEDMDMILSDTKVFIHSAASIRFDEPILIPFNINTRGTMRALDIAKRMPLLASFVHVSTAFVVTNYHSSRTMESAPDFTLGNPREVFEMLVNASKEEAALFEETALKSYPNTYGVAKVLSECMIHERYNDLGFPVVIVRPTAICSSMSEPFPGWTLGLGSVHFISKSVGLEYIQNFAGRMSNKLDVIPIDYVCKTILAAATVANSSMTYPLTFHVGTSHNNAILLEDMCKHIVSYWKYAPVPQKRISNDIRLGFHSIDELDRLFDQRYGGKLHHAMETGDSKTVNRLQGIYEKSRLFLYYFTEAHVFDMTNAIQLDDTAPYELQSGLRFQLNWSDYMYRVCYGVHKYLMGGIVRFPPVNQTVSRL
ncbi:cyclin-dependent kinase inhibitor far1, partial [Entomortierella beljakovae]